MTLAELTFDEQIALVALLELVIGGDARVSDEEHAEVQRIADAIGRDAYRKAVAEVDRRFETEEDVQTFVPTISRPAAREVIFETVLEAALPETVDRWEANILGWLGKAWGLEIRPQKSNHPS